MADPLIRLMQALFLPAAHAVRDPSWRPAADIYQTEDGWLVKFDLAGVRPHDIELSVRGRRLTVSGSRRDWCAERGCSHYSMEIAYSRFERTVELPGDRDPARVTAEHQHGMLLVHIEN